MYQTITIHWKPVDINEMPSDEGTYLVAFDDGTVESYPMSQGDLICGEIRAGGARGIYGAESPPYPNP